MEELGAECDRLGVKVVDVHGVSGSASGFLATVARYIEAREKELHGRRWIPVTERLPNDGKYVLAWNRCDTQIIFFDCGKWLNSNQGDCTICHEPTRTLSR
jgi:hypothetical protein